MSNYRGLTVGYKLRMKQGSNTITNFLMAKPITKRVYRPERERERERDVSKLKQKNAFSNLELPKIFGIKVTVK
jgi:cystathionine beta-lyase/cystathionine gamma-synthase